MGEGKFVMGEGKFVMGEGKYVMGEEKFDRDKSDYGLRYHPGPGVRVRVPAGLGP